MRQAFFSLAPIAAALVFACSGGDVGTGGALRTYPDADRGVTFADPEDVNAYLEAGNADVVFVDNRNAFVFEQQRITGARLIPTDQMARSLGSLPLNKWLILYCT